MRTLSYDGIQTELTQKDFEDIEDLFKRKNIWNDYITIEFKIIGGKIEVIQPKPTIKRPNK